ncbi:MAG: HisA/HisF-related TIM barrel protein, partial [Mucinivorans sp.]
MIQIIPAIDLIGGHCVRLTQGDYGQSKSYSSDPVALARSYEDIGLKRLHMVDLDGAKFSQPMNLDVLSAVAESCSLEIQWGGGVKSRQSLEEVLKAGAKRVICGSVAVSNPQMMESWIEEFGRERVVLGADIKNGFISINGWLQQSQVTVQELIARFNPSQVICTD